MKLLLSAFSCGPNRGSEQGIGWNWVIQASRRHEVWLITCDEYPLEVQQNLPANVHASFLPSVRRYWALKALRIPGLDWLYYYWWQWKVYRKARRLHAEVGFDAAHHVTYGSWRVPSFLCLLPVPLIWGPVGGGEKIPRGLRGELGCRGRMFELVRDAGNRLSRWDPLLRLSLHKAAVILAGNRDTAAILPHCYAAKTQILSAIGISPSELVDTLPSGGQDGYIVLFVGVLEPRKAGTLALKAFARFGQARRDAKLVLIGQGGQRTRLAALVRDLGIADRVQFLGGLKRSEVQGWMRVAQVFLLPSLRDSGGFVFLEAMMAGIPVVCLDLGGPGELVSSDCGIKVRPQTREQTVADLASALETLAASPGLRRSMGQEGQRRVGEKFDWDKKGDRMSGLYRQVAERVATS